MKIYFPEIDGLRGFLALWVVAFHFQAMGFKFGGWLQWLDHFMDKGGNVPSYFFVASGLLIMNTYLIDGKVAYTAVQFFGRRAFRIFPLLHAVILYKVCTGWPFGWAIFSNMFLLFGFLPYRIEAIPIYVSWSIFVEETFYVIVPLIARILNFRNILFCLFLSFFSVALYYKFLNGSDFLKGMDYNTPFSNYHYFFAGLVLYLGFKDGWFTNENISRTLSVTFDIVAFAILLVSYFYPLDYGVYVGTALVASTLIKRSVFQRIWRLSFLRWVGIRCYSVYLIHPEVLGFGNQRYIDDLISYAPEGTFRTFSRFLIYVALVLGISNLTHKWIEIPFMKISKKLFPRTATTFAQ